MLRSIASNLILTISFAQAAYSQTMDEILKKYEIPAAERILSDGRILISVSSRSDFFTYDVVYDGQIYRCTTFVDMRVDAHDVTCILLNSR